MGDGSGGLEAELRADTGPNKASRLKLILLLTTLHGSLLVTSTVAGSKMVALPFGLSASATVISYLLTFVVLDTIAEIFGRRISRFVINLGLLGMAVSALYFEFTILLPPASFWSHQAEFQAVLEASWRIWLGGWIAYMVSQYLDLWSFLKLKEVGGLARSITLRAWIGMLLGQLLDTVIFVVIAFYDKAPLASLITGQYLVKVILASLAAPLVALAVTWGRRWIQDADVR
jgi:uncharacterized integral membrane protein (TIGR00697 family)